MKRIVLALSALLVSCGTVSAHYELYERHPHVYRILHPFHRYNGTFHERHGERRELRHKEEERHEAALTRAERR